jgi:hep_Hag family protein
MANHKITNVENAEISINSKDAINGSQLYNAMNNLNQNMTSTISNHVNQLENRIYKVEAGVASAMAIAGLTQAYLTGKNMFSMVSSIYQGHTGYAIGLSNISDNSK